jgi:hypothetical protein
MEVSEGTFNILVSARWIRNNRFTAFSTIVHARITLLGIKTQFVLEITSTGDTSHHISLRTSFLHTATTISNKSIGSARILSTKWETHVAFIVGSSVHAISARYTLFRTSHGWTIRDTTFRRICNAINTDSGVWSLGESFGTGHISTSGWFTT